MLGECWDSVRSDLLVEILYEDNHCLAVCKPAGLLTQGSSVEIPSLEEQAKQYLREKYHKAGRVYLGVPHRLDRPVSGVVLFARQTKSAQRLAEQFRNRQVKKKYWAILEGKVEPQEGAWEDWIRKVPGQARAEKGEKGDEGTKQAQLNYRCLNSSHDFSRVEIELLTGRMHQIRLQSSSRGWPVIGDFLYGARSGFGETPHPSEAVIALHARNLTFLHPIRFEPITLTAPLPEKWNNWLRTQGLHFVESDFSQNANH